MVGVNKVVGWGWEGGRIPLSHGVALSHCLSAMSKKCLVLLTKVKQECKSSERESCFLFLSLSPPSTARGAPPSSGSISGE